jgi:hypothetical protein
LSEKVIFTEPLPDMSRDRLRFYFGKYQQHKLEQSGGIMPKNSVAAANGLLIEETPEWSDPAKAMEYVRFKAKANGEAVAVRLVGGAGVDPGTKQRRKNWLIGARVSDITYDPGL